MFCSKSRAKDEKLRKKVLAQAAFYAPRGRLSVNCNHLEDRYGISVEVWNLFFLLDWCYAVNSLSIVIPATGSQAEIDDTLLSILENRPSDCEIIVVHDPSYVDPYDLADEVRFVSADGSKRLDTRMLEYFNLGFEHSDGEIVHTMMPGLTVGAGWCETALQLFEDDRNVGSVAPCVVAKGNRRTIQGVAYHSGRGKRIVRSSKRPIVAPLLGTGFFQASCLRFMRGFEPRFGCYADIELGLRFEAARYKAVKCDSRIYSEAKQKFSPILGYRGGKLRGDLHSKAKQVGLTTSHQGVLGLLSEPMNNGWNSLGALFGRMAAVAGRPSGQVLALNRAQESQSLQADSDAERTRRAA